MNYSTIITRSSTRHFNLFFSTALLIVLFATLLFSSMATAHANEVVGLNDDEQAALTLINDYRREHGLGELVLQENLIATARWMSQDLANKNYFSHIDSQGRDPFQRQQDFGYTGAWKGENLAAGMSASGDVLTQWKDSPAHNDNLLRPEYKQVGISRYQNPESTYQYYWAITFGSMEP